MNAPATHPAVPSATACRRAIVALICLAGVAVNAADNQPITLWQRIQDKGICERIWDKLRLCEDEENSFIQEASIIGRYQGQHWSVDANQGDADDWENRRMFLGAEALFLHQLRVQAQIRISEDFDPFYDGLFQAFVRWSPGTNLTLDVGRVDFTLAGSERSASSTKIATFERGLLVNQLMPGEVVGATAEGKFSKFSYRAGIFSGSIEEAFTDFSGGVAAVAGVGYDLPLFYDEGDVHLDYVLNDGDSGNNAFKSYDQVVSLWHQGKVGPFEMGVDVTWGHGLSGRPAVFGLTLLPTCIVARDMVHKGDAFQAVVRYQFANSDGNNGLQLQSRYEQEVVPGGYGDVYQAVYAGLNYLVFGDRFKLMTGVEYASMKDAANDGGEFNGWTYLAGVRLYF